MNTPSFLTEDEQKDVQTIEANWKEILTNSVIVKIAINQWWPYVRLSPAHLANMGTPVASKEGERVIDQVLHGGQINLIPAQAHKPVQLAVSRTRANLRKYTMGTMFGALLSDKAYPLWKESHDEYQKDFWSAVEFEISNFDTLVEANRLALAKQFGLAWDRLALLGEATSPRNEFIDSALTGIMAHLPDLQVVKDSYGLQTTFAAAPMVDEVAESEARAARSRLETIQSSEYAESTRKRILAEMMGQAERDAETRRKEIMAGLNQVEAEFYNNIVATLSELQTAVEGRGHFVGRQSDKLRSLVEHVRSMNVFGNEELTRRLDRVGEALAENRIGGVNDMGSILGEAATYVKTELATIRQQRGIRTIGDESEDQVDLSDRRVNRAAVNLASGDDGELTIRRRVVHAA